jgi:hypothetical protein
MPPGATTERTEPSEEQRSKDEFFRRLAIVGEDMIAAHGKEFAMGALILLARFIAEGRALNKPPGEAAAGCTKAATAT